MSYIMINDEAYDVNTNTETLEARRDLALAGIDSAKIWNGEGPDCVRTNSIVWALGEMNAYVKAAKDHSPERYAMAIECLYSEMKACPDCDESAWVAGEIDHKAIIGANADTVTYKLTFAAGVNVTDVMQGIAHTSQALDYSNNDTFGWVKIERDTVEFVDSLLDNDDRVASYKEVQ